LDLISYTRFAKKQGVQIYGTLFSLFVLGIIVPVFAILTGSATITIYGGEAFWNPLTIVNQWMVEEYSAGSRAAAFFAGLGFLISQIAENVYGNAYSGGMDLAGTFPKYINIRRGCLICALLSWAVQPWLFYNTASAFVSTMASFTVFIVPLVGIMVADYFIIRKQRIELSQLYTSASDGAYWFTYGVNWRCITVWVVCFAPGMPGMISSINPNIVVGAGMQNYFRGNYIFSKQASTNFLTP
jgi:NCS1 family nucleobase:cation symporter-1